MEWQTIGTVGAEVVRAARLELHWAAQVIGAAADGWIEKRADDGHTNMEWRGGELLGNPAPGGVRVALAVAELALRVRDGAGGAIATRSLTGATLTEAMAWTDLQLAGAAGGAARGIRARDYDMPAHPVASGARFGAAGPGHGELARWYGNAAGVLAAAVADLPGATTVRCWPHHFDIGAIVFLDPAGPAESAAQIGLGLSPGDHHIEEPYFYVTPYPIRAADLPALAGGGRWHREGFTGAVLAASALAAAGDGDAQVTAARAFLRSAIDGSRAVIAG